MQTKAKWFLPRRKRYAGQRKYKVTERQPCTAYTQNERARTAEGRTNYARVMLSRSLALYARALLVCVSTCVYTEMTIAIVCSA